MRLDFKRGLGYRSSFISFMKGRFEVVYEFSYILTGSKMLCIIELRLVVTVILVIYYINFVV